MAEIGYLVMLFFLNDSYLYWVGNPIGAQGQLTFRNALKCLYNLVSALGLNEVRSHNAVLSSHYYLVGQRIRNVQTVL